MEKAARPRGRFRLPELDGLRVLMIFIVSWYHIWQQSWLTPAIGSCSLDFLVRSGYVWVDGTVLLSAFLLYLPCVRAARLREPLPDAAAFYRRRACRVLPGYVFILLLTLFAVALPWKLYVSAPFLVKDVVLHLTFLFTFFQDTYVASPLGSAAWTLAVMVQAYVLFPLVASGMRRHPFFTCGILLAVCFGFRAWCIWALPDYTMVVNQLPNFGDVYVAGLLSAVAFDRLSAWRDRSGQKKARWLALAATAGFFVSCFVLVRMLHVQAASQGYATLQRNQMVFRPVFALCFAGLTLCAPFSLRPLRRLLGNAVTRFLAGISMNYYLIHPVIIVHLKRLGFPPSVSDTPHMAGEQPWQWQYTLLSFGLSLLAATLITYFVERPGARLLHRWLNWFSASASPARPESSRSERRPAS